MKWNEAEVQARRPKPSRKHQGHERLVYTRNTILQRQLLTLGLIVAAVSSGGCRSVSASKREAKQPPVIWGAIESWTGRGDTQTDSFNIETWQFRLRWRTTNESAPGSGWFKMSVHSAVSGRELSDPIEYRGVGSDIAYITEDPHLCYLVIDSKNVDWSVTVEEPIVRGESSRANLLQPVTLLAALTPEMSYNISLAPMQLAYSTFRIHGVHKFVSQPDMLDLKSF